MNENNRRVGASGKEPLGLQYNGAQKTKVLFLPVYLVENYFDLLLQLHVNLTELRRL